MLSNAIYQNNSKNYFGCWKEEQRYHFGFVSLLNHTFQLTSLEENTASIQATANASPVFCILTTKSNNTVRKKSLESQRWDRERGIQKQH